MLKEDVIEKYGIDEYKRRLARARRVYMENNEKYEELIDLYRKVSQSQKAKAEAEDCGREYEET